MHGKATVWSKRIAAWRSSGESAAAWCRARGAVVLAVRVLATSLVGAGAGGDRDPSPAQTGAVTDVEVVLPSGVRLRVPALPMAELAALVLALC